MPSFEQPPVAEKEPPAEDEKNFQLIDELIDAAEIGRGKTELTYALVNNLPGIKEKVIDVLEGFEILKTKGGVPKGGQRIGVLKRNVEKLIELIRPEMEKKGYHF